MSFWQSILGTPKNSDADTGHAPSAPQHRGRNVAVTGRILTLRSPTFFGRAHISPNGRWVVGRRDADVASGRGGCRDSGNGLVLLVDLLADAVVLELTSLARPTDAAVADNGILAVVDTGFGLALASTFLVFDVAGRPLLTRHFQANLCSIGLSRCGRFAAAQTCNNPESDDGNRLEVSAVAPARTLFSRTPATAWADAYDFDAPGGRLEQVRVHVRALGWFRHAADGTFLDAAEYFDARLTRGDYADALMAADELLARSSSLADAQRCLDAADRALQVGAAADVRWSAQARQTPGRSLRTAGRPSRCDGRV